MEKETILEGIDVSQAMIVDDFIIYTTPSDVSPGNTGKLYRKRLGSNERAILVARELADPQTLCQTENEILVNGLGDTWNNSSSLQQAVVSFSTDSGLKTNYYAIKPRVV